LYAANVSVQVGIWQNIPDNEVWLIESTTLKFLQDSLQIKNVILDISLVELIRLEHTKHDGRRALSTIGI